MFCNNSMCIQCTFNEYSIYQYLICIAPCFAIFQCVFNAEVYIILTMLILSWIEFILPLILRGAAYISSGAADMASKAAKICQHGTQCNQHGEADTP